MCVCVCVCACVCVCKKKKAIRDCKYFFYNERFTDGRELIFFCVLNKFILEIFVLNSQSPFVAYNPMGLYFRSCWTIYNLKSFILILWGVVCLLFFCDIYMSKLKLTL